MKKLVSVVLCILFMLMVFCISASAANSNLDKIRDYEVKVDVRQDGTMDIRYAIEWEVLSDKNGKEPLTWVKVGIPNEHVDQLQQLTDNIESIEYYSKGGGSYVRIDFKEKYYQGAVVNFEFSIHQSYMYLLDEKDTVRYAFTPGWFEDIEIDNLQIEWAVKDGFEIKTTDSNEQSSSYYIWSYTNLAEGEKVTANVKYSANGFYVDEKMQYKEGKESLPLWAWIIIVVIIILVIAFLIAIIDDGYGGGSGGVFVHSSCAHSSCAHSSCACACACAGGGRAGCSVKEFYHNDRTISVEDFDIAISHAEEEQSARKVNK